MYAYKMTVTLGQCHPPPAMLQLTYLAAVSSVMVVGSWRVHRGVGGRGGEDVDDIRVHHFILLLQQVKDTTNGIRSI